MPGFTKLERLQRKLVKLKARERADKEYRKKHGKNLPGHNVNDVMVCLQDIAIEKLKEHPVTTARLRRAMRRVINYSWDKEFDDWQIQFAENGDALPKGHIFNDLVILEEWLKRGW
ncbi:MAG: hypothetical protein GTN93_10500 [Anaerolineae bacterium]|nr:hypothetical protein [Anaerolineae bacterium]